VIDQTSEGVCACLDRIQLLIAYCLLLFNRENCTRTPIICRIRRRDS